MQENLNTQQDTLETPQEFKNFDEDLLLSSRVDPNYNEEILHQILRIAVYDEYRAYETYKKILEKFGDISPFNNIIHAEVRHYQALIILLEKYQVEVPVNDWEIKAEAPNTILEACELGVAAELDNIKMYDNLIGYAKDYPDVLDLMYQLQAASYNNHLPAFRKHVISLSSSMETNSEINQTTQETQASNQANQEQINNPMKNIDEIMGKMEEFNQIASKVASGEVAQEDIMKLLNSENISLLGGTVLGAIGTSVLTQMVKDNKQNHSEGEE